MSEEITIRLHFRRHWLYAAAICHLLGFDRGMRACLERGVYTERTHP